MNLTTTDKDRSKGEGYNRTEGENWLQSFYEFTIMNHQKNEDYYKGQALYDKTRHDPTPTLQTYVISSPPRHKPRGIE